MNGWRAWAICAVLFCTAANAQVEPEFRVYGMAEGLPSNQLVDVIQDRQGLLWMASPDGLASFDGVSFRVFRHDPNDARSIPCNDVQTVFEDSRQRLWFGCAERGFGLLTDRAGGHFDGMTTVLAPLGHDTLDVYAFAESRAGHLWMGSYRHGVLRMDADATALQRLDQWMTIPDALKHADVLDLLYDSAGDLWMATTDGVWRVRNIDTPERARAEQLTTGMMVVSLFESADATVWIGGARALHKLAVAAEASAISVVDTGAPLLIVDGIAEDRDSAIWLGTTDGLVRIATDGLITRIKPRVAVPHSLPASHVQELMFDREGGMWLATRQDGLAYSRPDRANFHVIRHDALDDRSLIPGRLVGLTVCADGSTLVASGAGGLARIDADGGIVRIGIAPRAVAEGRSTHGLVCADDGALWLGLRDAVARRDLRSGKERVWAAAEGILPGYATMLVAGHHGEVWVSSLGVGISRIAADGSVRTWQTAEHGIAIAEIEQIGMDAKGGVWLADAIGIRVLNPDTEIFERPQGGPRERVTSFAFTAAGTLWTASNAVLEHWQWNGDVLQRIAVLGAEHGVPAVAIHSMVIDLDGDVWLTSPRGLLRLRKDAARVELIDTRHGLPNPQFSSTPSMLLAQDKVTATSVEGVLRFDPRALISVEETPPLQLIAASVRRGDQRIALDPLAAHWGLRWNDRDLQVSARVLSYVDPAANHYGFRLEGHDAEWIDAGAHTDREFSSIEPGRYRLRIRGSNLAGVAADHELSKTLTVAPPPWLTWQAWLAYALALVAMVWWLFASWRKRIERRHRLALAEARRNAAERANTAKTDFLADIGHEIRTPMAGVLGMTDLLARSPLDSDQQRWTISIKRSGEHMLRLINDLLDLSRIEAGRLDIHPQPIELRHLIDEVRTLEAPIAMARGLAFVTDIDPTLPRCVLIDGRRVRQILLNLVNNALKFTERGEVGIAAARIDDDWMRLRVTDTGPGMSAEQVAILFDRFRQTRAGEQKGGSGLGLAISAQLAHLLGGRIEVSSTPAVGSCFDVILPLAHCADSDVIDTPVVPADDALLLAGIEVLLVEDDPAIREVNTQLLKDFGAEVTVSQHALDALSRFVPTRHRLALIDLDLPGIDGLQLITLLRTRWAGVALIAVAVTARSAADTEQRCLDAGFDEFMRKPVSADMLRLAAVEWRRRIDQGAATG